jgi:hypothetical protein
MAQAQASKRVVPLGAIIVNGFGGLLIAAGAIGLFAPGALPQIPALADPATAWTLLGAGIALDLGAAAVIVQRMRSRQ